MNSQIYDIEKTVVDIVFYREKVGIEETKEILFDLSAEERPESEPASEICRTDEVR